MEHQLTNLLAAGWGLGLFTAIARRTVRNVAADRDGWRTVRPGLYNWAPLVGCAAFALLLFYVYNFVGSALPDAESQMHMCLGLGIASAFGAVLMLWNAFGRTLAWRGDQLRITPLIGASRDRLFAEVAKVRKVRRDYRVIFADGASIEVSPYMHGASQLLDAIIEHSRQSASGSIVMLRVLGEDLDPEEITSLLGTAPGLAFRRGELVDELRGQAVAELGVWALVVEEPRGNLDGQLRVLLARVTADLDVWRELTARYKCEIRCGVFMAKPSDAVTLDPQLVAQLASRNISVNFDFVPNVVPPVLVGA
jgi:hypothetical protein